MKGHSASLEKRVPGEKSYLFVTKRRGPPQALPRVLRRRLPGASLKGDTPGESRG